MKFEAARAAIYARIATAMTAAHSSTIVEYENRVKVDRESQVEPFVTVELEFNDGEQVALGTTPPVRYRGAVYASVWCKEGSGVATGLGLLASLADSLKTAMFGGVTTNAPRPLPGYIEKGWHIQSLRVPFHFDDLP